MVAIILSSMTVGCGADPPSALVGVRVEGCSLVPKLGSGVMTGDGLVLTAAHTLRGARSIEVRPVGGRSLAATIVGFDPELDLAYLAVEAGPADPSRALTVDSDHVEAGDRAVAWVIRRDGPARVDVTVRRRVTINTEDIYIEGDTERPGFELDTVIEPGDSGGAVLVDGKVIGVLWARSRRFPGRAYAIDADRGGALISAQLASGELGDGVDVSRCG